MFQMVSDPQSLYNTDLGRFTVPYACYVEVHTSVCLDVSSNKGFNVHVWQNNISNVAVICTIGINTGSPTGVQPGYQTGCGMAVVSCASGDYLSLKTYTGGNLFSGSCIFKIL